MIRSTFENIEKLNEWTDFSESTFWPPKITKMSFNWKFKTSSGLPPYYSIEHRKYALRVISICPRGLPQGNTCASMTKMRFSGVKRLTKRVSFEKIWNNFSEAFPELPGGLDDVLWCILMPWTSGDHPWMIPDWSWKLLFFFMKISLKVTPSKKILSPAFTHLESIDSSILTCNPH